jgi:hypothetical protein
VQTHGGLEDVYDARVREPPDDDVRLVPVVVDLRGSKEVSRVYVSITCARTVFAMMKLTSDGKMPFSCEHVKLLVIVMA